MVGGVKEVSPHTVPSTHLALSHLLSPLNDSMDDDEQFSMASSVSTTHYDLGVCMIGIPPAGQHP